MPCSPAESLSATRSHPLLSVLYTLFVLSGFSALIYQSIWSQYMGLLLGHAAYAQTLVLIMFMGGMALGAWAVSRFTLGVRRLLGLYALAEGLIALCGGGFHGVFIWYSGLSQEVVLPALRGSAWAELWQWGGAGLLIAPQTLLLGATFPLVAAGILRLRSQDEGQVLGTLYFTNSMGAALGVLCATFVLLPLWGMPGALWVAAGINALLALATWRLSVLLGEGRRAPVLAQAVAAGPAVAEAPALVRLRRVLLITTFASSAASFGYEIGWVRLLNQALGTTLHGFELMLAAFITGLALGGLWVRKRSTGLNDVVRYAGFVQVAMGFFALLSVPVLASSFGWVGWMMSALAPSEQGYVLYSLGTATIAMLVMVPAAFCAGMTLPLFTTALLRQGASERAVGQIYAANTLGAIAGVLAAVHLLMPHVGVSLTIVIAALVDVVLGLLLLRGLSPGRWTPRVAGAGAAVLLLLCLVLTRGQPSQSDQAGGVFRYGAASRYAVPPLFYKDGATSSVAVRYAGDTGTIVTNGKPDAGLTWPDVSPNRDEDTMLMLGALPLALHPNPERVALIGWGSGLSTHTVLGSPRPRQVDTIEIEQAMWEGAQLFKNRNWRAYEDPRSHVRFEDARRFLSSAEQPYDVIISEPSNPWVSGVSSLFTREFYALTRRHLKEGGLLVQWVHLYEMSDALLAEMVAALQQVFPVSQFYVVGGVDLVIVASDHRIPELNSHPWDSPALAKELARLGMKGPADMQLRRVGNEAALRTFVRTFKVEPHSDFYPTVALQAPAKRFERDVANLPKHLLTQGGPLLRVLECRRPVAHDARLGGESPSALAMLHLNGLRATHVLLGREGAGALFRSNPELAQAVTGLVALRKGGLPPDAAALRSYLGLLAQATLGVVDEPLLRELWNLESWQADMPNLEAGQLAQLRLYSAMSQSDWPSATTQAGLLLGSDASRIPAPLREQYLILGMLASMAQGESMAVAGWEQRHGRKVERSTMAGLRDFLAAWEAGQERACVAGS